MAEHRFYQQFQSLIDSINHDSDPTQKLANLQQVHKDGMTLVRRARDEAAYELRSRYSSEDAEQLSGISRRHLDYWAKRHMYRHALPPLRPLRRVDLSNARNLSGLPHQV